MALLASVAFSAEWQRFSLLGSNHKKIPLKPEEFKKIERLVWTTHKFEPMDNVWKLASTYGTNAASIQSTAAKELIFVKPGFTIFVHNKRGTLHRVKEKNGHVETLAEITAFYKPRDTQAQEKLKEAIILANRLGVRYLVEDVALELDTFLLIPNTYLQFDTFRIPFKTLTRISSRFGMRYHPILGRKRFHEGLDFPKPYGTEVYASRSGRVIFADWRNGYGRCVDLKHSDGTVSRYGHLSQINVKQGEWTEAGKKVIGRVGSSGLSTGPHLHFEIRDKNGRAINPYKKIVNP